MHPSTLSHACGPAQRKRLCMRRHFDDSTTQFDDTTWENPTETDPKERQNETIIVDTRMAMMVGQLAFAQQTWTSRKNIFGGHDYYGPGGRRVTSRPNILGGHDYSSSNGKKWTSRSNIFGGQDYRGPGGKQVTSRANIFGGLDYRGPMDRG